MSILVCSDFFKANKTLWERIVGRYVTERNYMLTVPLVSIAASLARDPRVVHSVYSHLTHV